jgi:predicted PurR-regulated permease PerM
MGGDEAGRAADNQGVTPSATSNEGLYRAILFAAGLLVLGLLFQELVTLLIAVLITVLISIPVAAVATRLERYRIPRPIGALAGLLLLVGAVAGIIALVLPTFIDQADQFIDDVPGIVESLEEEVGDLTGDEPEEIGEEVEGYVQDLGDNPERLVAPVAAIGLGVAGFLAATVLVLISAYYIALRPQPLVEGALRLFPPARREWALAVGERIRAAWIGWMQGVVVDMLANGAMIWVGLTIIGLDFAVVFGVLAGLLTVVPYFGPIAASIPAILFGLADSPEQALLVAVVFVVVQQIEGNLTIPLVMAQTVRLHPALIAVGVVVVAQLLGFAGLFVAVPVLALIVILVDEIWVKPREAGLPAGAEPGAAGGAETRG